MQNILRERALAGGGQLQRGQNIGTGQMITANYLLTPDVAFSEGNAGGAGAALGLLPGRAGEIGGLLAAGMKSKVAQTSMVLSDTRTTVQIAAAEGSAKATDFKLGALLGAGSVGGGLGGYANTAEGKVIAASFTDNWNNIVRAVRGSLSAPAMAAATPQAGGGLEASAVLAAKIKGVKLYTAPDKASKVISSAASEFVFTGEEQGAFYKVAAADGEGWVEKIMVSPR